MSNMRVISPLGKLIEIERVVPIIEKKEKFNGIERFNGEVVREGTKPNGLAFKCSKTAEFDGYHELIVGNISSDKVEEIIVSLMRDGFYDLRMQYQAVKDSNKLVIDSTALPYTSEITIMMTKNYCSGCLGGFDFGMPPIMQNPFSAGSGFDYEYEDGDYTPEEDDEDE